MQQHDAIMACDHANMALRPRNRGDFEKGERRSPLRLSEYLSLDGYDVTASVPADAPLWVMMNVEPCST